MTNLKQALEAKRDGVAQYVVRQARDNLGQSMSPNYADIDTAAREAFNKCLELVLPALQALEYYAEQGSVGSHTSGHGDSSDHISFYYGLKIAPKEAIQKILKACEGE